LKKLTEFEQLTVDVNVSNKVTLEICPWLIVGECFSDLRMGSGNGLQVDKMIRLLVLQSNFNPFSEKTFV
jgi:hypothetical protein